MTSMNSLAKGGEVLASAPAAHVRHRQLEDARRQLRMAEQRYETLRNRSASYYRSSHPNLNRKARRQMLGIEREFWRGQVGERTSRVEVATKNAKEVKPLTRAGERARALWNSPLTKGASKVLGPVGTVVSVVDAGNDLRQGNYLDAAVTGTTVLATAAMLAFPVAGGTVLVAATLYQNREAIMNGGCTGSDGTAWWRWPTNWSPWPCAPPLES